MDVWGRLIRDGWGEVQRWLNDKEPEGLQLDFKEKGRESAVFDDNDLGRVARALSAFANVEGGVLVLGVSASGSGSKKEPDRATAVPGVPGADAAHEVIDRRLKTLTDPPVVGAQVHVVREPGTTRAIVAILVPQSDGGPHRVAVGKDVDRYLIRVASHSLAAPHAVLAGMFGRRPPPQLRLAVCREADGSGTIFVRNHGRGIARDVYVRMTIGDVHQPDIIEKIRVIGWERAIPTRMRGKPIYLQGRRAAEPVHALDTVRIASFAQSDTFARIFVCARIDAEGMQPMRCHTAVTLNVSELREARKSEQAELTG
jgi:hypothetical protein